MFSGTLLHGYFMSTYVNGFSNIFFSEVYRESMAFYCLIVFSSTFLGMILGEVMPSHS